MKKLRCGFWLAVLILSYAVNATTQAEVKKGMVSVTTYPIDLEVYVNRTRLGSTPMIFGIQTGTHRLEIKYQEHVLFSEEIAVTEDVPVVIDKRFKEEIDKIDAVQFVSSTGRKHKEKEVRQPGTYLFWLRCARGRDWNGSSCVGKGSRWKEGWEKAVKSCPSGYRLPTKEELLGLLEGCRSLGEGPETDWKCLPCNKSKDCREMFPSEIPEGTFWSSTDFAENTAAFGVIKSAYSVNLAAGTATTIDLREKYFIRCVRTGP